MAYKTQAEINAMMALPMGERPSGWAWWMTQEMAAAADAADRAEEQRMADAKAARLARIAAENAAEGPYLKRGAGYCTKCKSYCHGDCQA